MTKPIKNTLTYVDSYGNSHTIHKFAESHIDEAFKDLISILRYAQFGEESIARWLEGATLDF
jgi:hypothetical protein